MNESHVDLNYCDIESFSDKKLTIFPIKYAMGGLMTSFVDRIDDRDVKVEVGGL